MHEMQLRYCVYCMKGTWNTTVKSVSATLTLKKLQYHNVTDMRMDRSFISIIL